MAAGTTGVSISSEQVQRLLQCAICLDRFKRPKLLPCQHTFCLSPCLEGLVEHRTRSIRCPECRADHFVPRAGVASFPNNLTIIGFLSLSDAPNTEQAREEARTSVSGSENLDDLENEFPAQQMQDELVDDGGCYVCHSQSVIQRCCHCERLVCDVCYQEHMNLVKSDMARMIGTIRRGLPHITDQIVAVERKGRQLQTRCESVKVEFTEGVEKLIRELRQRERNLHEEVDSFFNGEMRGLRNYQENAEVEIASLSSFCDSVECLLAERQRIPAGDLMETKRQCEEHLETVHNYEDGSTRSPNLKQIQASLESPFLSSTISTLGEVIISNRMTRLTMLQAGQGTPANLTSRTNLSRFLEVDDDRRSRNAQQAVPQDPPSPSILRRSRAIPTQPARSSQVTFAEDNESLDEGEGRWDTLSHIVRHNRRSRQDRLSDSTLMNLTSGPSLSQRIATRARHQSLGALRIDEYDNGEELLTDRPQDTNYPDLLDQSRDSERDSNVSDMYSASYPGARSITPQFESSPTENRDDIVTPPSRLSSILYRNNPGRYVENPRNRYNQKGTAIIQVGTRGSEHGKFIWPRGLAVSHLDDRIYVSDSSNHRVQIFDNTGRFIKCFGTYGQNDGEFDCLAGIALTNFEQIVIADRYNHRIQIFDRNGNFQNSFGREGCGNGELNYPWGVACDNMGFIYVCDKENHRVQVFQANGTFVRTIGEHGSHIGQLENPHYVAVSPDNKVYVSDSSNHRIQVFSIYGDFLFSFGMQGNLRGQMKFPRGIAIDSQGFAVVADSGNNRIQVFRSDGRFYSMFGNWGSENGQFKGLEGVAIQSNGNIVISDRENHRFQIF